ncbi:uncharacterized protein CMU_037060 [Cryptosporidium muris RN66]|uniref:Uncharacterized protein n=1 Tax=Cryptosporidium muris (strain RN66) TaxID=441375 RepID=B6AH41_CRYMR|nr:uncharacterized protein CMU_037060 [Cryptosporidium muris RN66]EEA07532.1 hypothetical protein CMU_037060 [Cryptosporidium muris RN66]|eukprot:XP_002141881.1 hypothetical protein [Cryptosporidium muris RN66]
MGHNHSKLKVQATDLVDNLKEDTIPDKSQMDSACVHPNNRVSEQKTIPSVDNDINNEDEDEDEDLSLMVKHKQKIEEPILGLNANFGGQVDNYNNAWNKVLETTVDSNSKGVVIIE